MTASTPMPRRTFLGVLGAGATMLGVGACSGDSGSGSTPTASVDPNTPQTIEWWHIQNTEPMLPIWDELAKQYTSAHPNVTINITPIENEAFKARLTTVTQSGDAPDIFQTWGGGVLKNQVDAGLVKEVTADVQPIKDTLVPTGMEPYMIDGKLYAVPYDIGMVGFWYNKALFARAGITGTPGTWNELLDAVRKLKAANITPITIGGGQKWPCHYWWTYLAMRIAGIDGLQKAEADKKFDGPEFIQAGQRLKELVDLQPFQNGWQAAPFDTPDGEAAVMGNGQAALELQGQFAVAVQKEQSGKDLGADLSWFPFPTVDGGKGKVTDTMGGGGGFAVGKDAPPAAVDFLKFLVTPENQRKAVATGAVLPITKGVEDAVQDPRMKLVADAVAKSTGFQLYLDQDYAPSVGQTVNDAVTSLMNGAMSPEDVARAVTEAAQTA
ncbi:MAG TPA: extracellular solute-binding protein [Actinophytocola sp.]|uniref:extracellular solute-binding protein n=1 Tax=Actinophytocola sp. TaxID=1872138 RepID=UPI002DDD49C3|nr:extracellular solute-binding protein [Actinophytocola sp.]HEV2777829.1 extracellular solute-binding protein [Actinophytocola sp.]